jgi:hypothetical protein
MKAAHIRAIAFCLLIAAQSLYGGYEEEVLHIAPNTGDTYPRLFYAALYYHEGNKTYQLTVSSGFTGDEYKKPRYKNLKAKYPKEWIWSLYFKDYKDIPSVLLTDKPSKIRYELADNLGVLNIELVDPNMKQIKADDYPPDTIVEEGNYDWGEYIVIPNVVYLWNDNSPNKKMLCDLVVGVKRYPSEEDLMWQNIHDEQ